MREIVGSSVLILGYGVEGQSVHRWLKKFHPRLKIGIADRRPIKPVIGSLRNLKVMRSFVNFTNFDTIVRSPGISLDLPVLTTASAKSGSAFGGKAASKYITSATNIFFSVCPGKIIAVTGTKGKSTTASLIYSILSRVYPDVRLVGNIGNPALDYLEGADKNTLFVIELSSYQLEDFRYSPFVAVILDVVPEHLDRYRDFNEYVIAKSQIVRFQSPADYVIFNPDHEIPAKIASLSPAQKISFSLSKSSSRAAPSDWGSVAILWPENCLAAIAVAGIFDVPPEKIRQAIAQFKSLPHRLEYIGNFNGIDFYDDSIATIPQATIHALNALGEKVETLIAGGFDRGLDYSELGKFLVNRKGLKNLILFPDTGKKIWLAILAAAKKQKQPLHLMKLPVSSMKQAVDIAFANTATGKICLLSPAAPSYNLYKNFEERGNKYGFFVRRGCRRRPGQFLGSGY